MSVYPICWLNQSVIKLILPTSNREMLLDDFGNT